MLLFYFIIQTDRLTYRGESFIQCDVRVDW